KLSRSFRFIVTQQRVAKTFGRRQSAGNHYLPGTFSRGLSSRCDALLTPQLRDALNTKAPVTTRGLLGKQQSIVSPALHGRFTTEQQPGDFLGCQISSGHSCSFPSRREHNK